MEQFERRLRNSPKGDWLAVDYVNSDGTIQSTALHLNECDTAEVLVWVQERVEWRKVTISLGDDIVNVRGVKVGRSFLEFRELLDPMKVRFTTGFRTI